ncbi:hypothetical protein ASPZODRAFT_147688 [Penicilliopsis zonata CBS 506.65]|uniref:Transcription factor domain-containing protein n=1 Tax=Penicilliopsis zonata CBS 506.65 TaxID=1073090 RepID=A0A1L9S4Y1_9EURO|nr:hypothetical protein ASPZODRAFT_147688 [Penicilliopsis zonata CBS 506.65]OJJ42204.1 hypothetical protein ASPZODRAFT_147688 [Penicilliopsis zonata CBS 506.65]
MAELDRMPRLAQVSNCQDLKRKVKCIPQDDSICAGYEVRNTSCLSQENIDDPSSDTNISALTQRMERVESLLESLMGSINRGESTSTQESRPVFATPSRSSHSFTSKMKTLRRQLAGMLPCQAVVDYELHSDGTNLYPRNAYLSTLLGLPFATGSTAVPLGDAWMSPEDEDQTHSFSTTQRISGQLESLAQQMLPSWRKIPATIPNTRTREASAVFERVICQIWHFELATLLRLSFMLRAASDARYKHSRISCFAASRELIKRWMAIRASSDIPLLFSQLLEFQAFTAATTLLLGVLGAPRITVHDALQDHCQLVEAVVERFAALKQQGTAQSITVIRTLKRFLHGNVSERLRLEIPYFGVISIARNSGNVLPELFIAPHE